LSAQRQCEKDQRIQESAQFALAQHKEIMGPWAVYGYQGKAGIGPSKCLIPLEMHCHREPLVG
jgi:hypothetical protein